MAKLYQTKEKGIDKMFDNRPTKSFNAFEEQTKRYTIGLINSSICKAPKVLNSIYMGFL